MEYSSAGSMFSAKSGKSFRMNIDVINRLEAKLGAVIPSFLVAQGLWRLLYQTRKASAVDKPPVIPTDIHRYFEIPTAFYVFRSTADIT